MEPSPVPRFVAGEPKAKLSDEDAKHLAEAWLVENVAAIALYNERVLESGTFGDELRMFWFWLVPQSREMALQ